MTLSLRFLLAFGLIPGALPFVHHQDSGAAVAAPAERFEATRGHLEAQVQKGAYLGVVALVEVAGERVLEVAAGERDAAADAPMELDTIFRIYSMTKPVTATAAMILVDEGELELDAPVSRYLPSFAGLEVGVESKDEQGAPVLTRVPCEREMTIRDLCRHTAGLTYGIFGQSPVDKLVLEAGVFDPDTTTAGLVEKLSGIPLKTQPGSCFEYSLASDVLGRVVEVVSGEPLDEFMQVRIFEPLGMRDTGFFVPEAELARVSVCYRRANGELVPTGPGQAVDPRRRPNLLSGGGGLFSTADDYLRFCRMLLGGGALGEVRVLSEESVAEMLRDQLDGIPAPMLAFTGGAFGLGLALITPERETGPQSGTAWWGGLAGTGFWIDPQGEQIAVFMIQSMNEILHVNGFQRSVYEDLGR